MRSELLKLTPKQQEMMQNIPVAIHYEGVFEHITILSVEDDFSCIGLRCTICPFNTSSTIITCKPDKEILETLRNIAKEQHPQLFI
jgi:hypothetical protein